MMIEINGVMYDEDKMNGYSIEDIKALDEIRKRLIEMDEVFAKTVNT